MNTHLRRTRTAATQPVAPFTGEGAYHGSTKPRPAPAPAVPEVVVAEVEPHTLARYAEPRAIDRFTARFTNRHDTLAVLPVPSQRAIADDAVTFCWCPIDAALREAGPLTRGVLAAMQAHLTGRKRYVYIDSKIQYFRPGDVPVDSQHWHVDGSIVARDERVRRLGHAQLHDMRARLDGPAEPPTYLSYQSSEHCATLFVAAPVTLTMPELIADFTDLDRQVRELDPPVAAQPAGAIVRFDGLSLHRAQAAHAEGWRLWIRCAETDRRVEVTTNILECYGTVYRLAAGA